MKIEKETKITRDSIFYTSFYDELSDENEPYRVIHSPITVAGKKYTFVNRINLVENEDLILSIVILFSVILTLLLLGLFVLSRKLSQRIWAPFYSILEQMEQFEIDKSIGLKLPETTIEEFNRLNSSIRNLIQKNISIYKSQREFIENAAHELQTPLAIFQAKIDTLFQRSDLNKEQAKIVNSLTENVSRLNRLNKNLLFLSKIERDNFSEKKEIDLQDVIENNIAFFKEQAQAKNIEITTQYNKSLRVNTNVVLVEVLIRNLFLNAVQHNISDGKIHVSISNQILKFSNTGKNEALNSEKLFNRFSKINSSDIGNGLGLSIIKKITEVNGWEITYDFTNNIHSFSIIT